MEQYISTKLAAEILGVHKHTLYRLIAQGILPCVKYGDVLKFAREDIEQLRKTGWTWNAQAIE